MKINSIQILRAFAVILVTHVHAIDLQMFFSKSFQQNFYYLQNLGAIGVDLFFVISGFIISHVAGNYTGINDGIKFISRRFLRINPVYYFVSILFFVLLCFLDESIPMNSLFIRAINTLFIIPVFNFQTHFFLPLLNVGWSLSFEWLFYLIYCCTILLKVRNKLPLLLIIIVGLVVAGRIYHPNFILTFYSHPLLLEFLFGAIIYSLYNKIRVAKGVAIIILITGVAGYIFNIFHNFNNIAEIPNIYSGEDQLNRVALWGIPSLFIFAGSLFIERAGAWRGIWNNSFLLLLGDASFSIYLCHYVTNYLLRLVFGAFGFFMNPDVAILFIMFIGITGGVIFYLKLEKPIILFFQSGHQKIASKTT
jgi:peptidoglycan/LPS O-acetylase OafA/YrhL